MKYLISIFSIIVLTACNTTNRLAVNNTANLPTQLEHTVMQQIIKI